MLFQTRQMRVKSIVRLGDKPFVELLFAYARLVARHEQNGLALGIKSKSHAPNAAGGVSSFMFA